MSATLQDAERDAAELLDSSWWITDSRDSPLPVDPIDLARGLGIRVITEALPPDQSGSIEMSAGGAVLIKLNRGDQANRRRFTCAHEIGHYLRRQERGVRQRSFIDYRSTLAGLGVDTEEIYANQFAAALLMPGHLVKKWYGRKSPERMAREFGTSEQAMLLRLRNLGLH